jgi:hypothetical protein
MVVVTDGRTKSMSNSDFNVFFGVGFEDSVDVDSRFGCGHTGIDGLKFRGVVSPIGELTNSTVDTVGGVFSVNSDADIEFLQCIWVGSC